MKEKYKKRQNTHKIKIEKQSEGNWERIKQDPRCKNEKLEIQRPNSHDANRLYNYASNTFSLQLHHNE